MNSNVPDTPRESVQQHPLNLPFVEPLLIFMRYKFVPTAPEPNASHESEQMRGGMFGNGTRSQLPDGQIIGGY
jgi:hypothetical protein